MKRSFVWQAVCILSFALTPVAFSQINTGSNGSDGAFNPTQNVTIAMSDHPDGIYQYTSVNIPQGVTVYFNGNSNNTPVIWLVQGDCTIGGTVIIDGLAADASGSGAMGGPGGFGGGNGGSSATRGRGPGGGDTAPSYVAGSGSYATLGQNANGQTTGAGPIYGNQFLLPLLGGSGGGGVFDGPAGGGGGGGAILIAASGQILLSGSINARGGSGAYGVQGATNTDYAGFGSGGAVRLVASTMAGGGTILAFGGSPAGNPNTKLGGSGRVRFDCQDNNFGGQIQGAVFTQGLQPIIIPAAGQGVQLTITSVAGNAIPSNPSGVLANPDVIVPAQTNNPVPVVVSCTNVPLNSEVTVTIHPASDSDVQAIGLNNIGSPSSSTATVSLNLPRGGGIIYASVVTGINGGSGTSSNSRSKSETYATTGLTTSGERFTKVETKVALGGKQQTTLITKSGKRYQVPN